MNGPSGTPAGHESRVRELEKKLRQKESELTAAEDILDKREAELKDVREENETREDELEKSRTEVAALREENEERRLEAEHGDAERKDSVNAFLVEAGKATSELADSLKPDESRPWAVAVEAPRWALDGNDSPNATHLIIATGALALGLGIVAAAAIFGVGDVSDLVQHFLIVAFAINVALVVIVTRSAIAGRQRVANLRLNLWNGVESVTGQPAAAAGIPSHAASRASAAPAPAPPPVPAGTPVEAPPPAGASPPLPSPSPSAAQGTTPLAPLANLIAREPVLIQALVLTAGALALAFGTDLSADDLGAILAAAAAALGLVTRNATVPVSGQPSATSPPDAVPAAPAVAPAPAGPAPAAPAPPGPAGPVE